MKKIIVLSTDNNPNYFYYLPIVAHYWRQFGWHVVCFVSREALNNFVNENLTKYFNQINYYLTPQIEGVRPGTCAQTVRHFAANSFGNDCYLMVQDIDLIPLSDFWKPDLNARTIYGWETTGKSFIPVHYTGMSADNWRDLMGLTGDMHADMERELKANGRAYKEKWEDYWDTDWDILTAKVKAKGLHAFNMVHRGMANGLPVGRVDRSTIVVKEDGSYSWGRSYNQDTYLDAHCENNNPASPEKWAMIRELLVKCYGSVPEWMDIYTSEFFALYGK